jgi:hypothetical protein
VGIFSGLDSFVNIFFGITLPGTFIDKKLKEGCNYAFSKPIGGFRSKWTSIKWWFVPKYCVLVHF